MGYRGKSLKALRESKKIRLRRISNETRISLVYLEDLEEERFDRFPGRFYFESFTKEYARALGLDSQEVLADLQTAYTEWSGDHAGEAPATPQTNAEASLLHRISDFLSGAQEV